MSGPSPRLLVIMGSGETTPTMVSTHRAVFERVLPGPAVMLDTPFGFQENVPQLVSKTRQYFSESLGQTMEVASLRGVDSGDLERQRAYIQVREASVVFAGPGSPTYALRVWRETEIPALLGERLRSGGAVVFASAAACCLGRFCLPVYEIYKAGEDVRWFDGLDLLRAVGLDCVVIPHYDNREGAGFDTRFCYMGERRLTMLEALLPAEVSLIGVDEHTAATLDLDADVFTVSGKGGVTLRIRGRECRFECGGPYPIDALRGRAEAGAALERSPSAAQPDGTCASPGPPELETSVRDLEAAFLDALASGRADAAADALLELDATLWRWSADPEQGGFMPKARSIFRSLLVKLGEAAREGLVSPRERIAPFAQALVDLREEARRERQWGLADACRARLENLGVRIGDTPQGTTWELTTA